MIYTKDCLVKKYKECFFIRFKQTPTGAQNNLLRLETYCIIQTISQSKLNLQRFTSVSEGMYNVNVM